MVQNKNDYKINLSINSHLMDTNIVIENPETNKCINFFFNNRFILIFFVLIKQQQKRFNRFSFRNLYWNFIIFYFKTKENLHKFHFKFIKHTHFYDVRFINYSVREIQKLDSFKRCVNEEGKVVDVTRCAVLELKGFS